MRRSGATRQFRPRRRKDSLRCQAACAGLAARGLANTRTCFSAVRSLSTTSGRNRVRCRPSHQGQQVISGWRGDHLPDSTWPGDGAAVGARALQMNRQHEADAQSGKRTGFAGSGTPLAGVFSRRRLRGDFDGNESTTRRKRRKVPDPRRNLGTWLVHLPRLSPPCPHRASPQSRRVGRIGLRHERARSTRRGEGASKVYNRHPGRKARPSPPGGARAGARYRAVSAPTIYFPPPSRSHGLRPSPLPSHSFV